VYVDSNIFVLAALDINKKGKCARKFVELAENDKISIFISPLVFDEVLQTIQKLANKRAFERIGRSLLSLPLSWLDMTYDAAIYAFEYYEIGLAPRDAMHVGVMRNYGIAVIVS
jgi:predicted nucleic acid-binding protein